MKEAVHYVHPKESAPLVFTIHLQSMDIRALFKKQSQKNEETKHKAQKKVMKGSGNVSYIKYLYCSYVNLSHLEVYFTLRTLNYED